MTSFKHIPILIESGQKYTNATGVTAIKDGVKSHPNPAAPLKKPAWLKISTQTSPKYEQVKALVRKHQLSTVCEEAKCPNIAECWSHGTATIMLMGAICTRACQFCSVDTGNPKGWLDREEPEKAADTVKTMQLDYVVLTSVDRDDLPDGGAQHYANTVRAIKKISSHTKVEALTPDFQGDRLAIQTLLDSGVDVFGLARATVRMVQTGTKSQGGSTITMQVARNFFL
jgi:lipoic acid synthetase